MQIRMHVNGHRLLKNRRALWGGGRGHILNCGKIANTCIIRLRLSLAMPGNPASIWIIMVLSGCPSNLIDIIRSLIGLYPITHLDVSLSQMIATPFLLTWSWPQKNTLCSSDWKWPISVHVSSLISQLLFFPFLSWQYLTLLYSLFLHSWFQFYDFCKSSVFHFWFCRSQWPHFPGALM